MPIYFWLFVGFMVYLVAAGIFSKKSYTPSEKRELENWMNYYKSKGFKVGIPDYSILKLSIILPKTKEDIANRIQPTLRIKPDFYIEYKNEHNFFHNSSGRGFEEANRLYIEISSKKAYLPFQDGSSDSFYVKEIPLPFSPDNQ